MVNVYQVIVILHVVAATIWIGGHIVISSVVLPRALRSRDPEIVRDFEAGYERVGIPALLVLVLTGLWLANRWVPGAGNWFSMESPLSHFIVGKLGLLLITIVLALHARLRIIPRLSADNLRFLAYHIVLVTILALGFLVLGVGMRTGGF